jgi:hypothetical protein
MMSTDQPASPTGNRRIALLIDAENVSHTKIAEILAELSKYGTANIRRAYGDWTNENLKGWKDKLHAFAIDRFSNSVIQRARMRPTSRL